MLPNHNPRCTAQGTGRGVGALLQFKTTLTGIRPPIWRRVLVPERLFLSGVHDVIQEVMGWTDSHLHDFHWREERFGVPDPEFDEEQVVDEDMVTLKALGLSVKDRLHYLYDFGDGWEHVLTVEKVLEARVNTVHLESSCAILSFHPLNRRCAEGPDRFRPSLWDPLNRLHQCGRADPDGTAVLH